MLINLDQTTIQYRGNTFEIALQPDDDAQATEVDIDPADLAAWRADDWCYVVVTTTLVVDGEQVKDAQDTIGGVEWGDSATFSITTKDIAERAIWDGWCDQAMESLRTRVAQRAQEVARLHARLDLFASTLTRYDASPALIVFHEGREMTRVGTHDEAFTFVAQYSGTNAHRALTVGGWRVTHLDGETDISVMPAPPAEEATAVSTPHGNYAIRVDGDEIDHADTRSEAKRRRDAIIYGGIGTEANTTIERKR